MKTDIRKSNLIYVLYNTFSSDLLFWIVIDNLFLTTVKGLNAFQIVLVTMLGLGLSLLLYPLVNLLTKKTTSQLVIRLGAGCYILAILLFMVCNTIYGFIFAQLFYNLSSPLRQVSNFILRNNLKERGKEENFVKWQSYGKLGYSFITLAISLCAGFLFNVWAYLPMILSLSCAVIGFIFACIYTEGKRDEEKIEEKVSVKFLFKNKMMILILFMNIAAVGTYIFMQSKTTLLIQNVCENVGLEVAKISIIVSLIVFISRLMRVLSNLIFPSIYRKVENKQKVLYFVGILLAISGICFAVGGNINANYILKIIFICIGFFIILTVRDIYAVLEANIIALNLPENAQKQAYVLANVFSRAGLLIVNAFSLIILGFLPLNILYICLLLFIISQMFICIPLAKYLKKK